MPLAYDDIPGSWGRQSEGWPAIEFATDTEQTIARSLVITNNLVPYGSYVTVGKTLRVETEAYKQIVLDALKERQC